MTLRKYTTPLKMTLMPSLSAPLARIDEDLINASSPILVPNALLIPDPICPTRISVNPILEILAVLPVHSDFLVQYARLSSSKNSSSIRRRLVSAMAAFSAAALAMLSSSWLI